jgi:hypothetical protein
MSAIRLEKNGRASAGKQSRHIDISVKELGSDALGNDVRRRTSEIIRPSIIQALRHTKRPSVTGRQQLSRIDDWTTTVVEVGKTWELNENN